MKNKKGNKLVSLVKDILIVGTVILGCLGIMVMLIPDIYYLLVYLFNLSLNIFSIAMIGVLFSGLVVALGIATKCIQFETTYEYIFDDDIEVDEELMRKQLSVVKSNEMVEQKVESVSSNKYSYVFDNNYSDELDEDREYVEEEIIDDVIKPYMRLVSVHRFDGGYSRVKANYRGKYSR